MAVIIGMVLVILLLTCELLRVIVLWIIGIIGVGGLVAVSLVIYLVATNDNHPPPAQPAVADGSAADYRAAQAAVAKATGRPCDYACKEAIADQARRGKDL